jgi:hypothetical protein
MGTAAGFDGSDTWSRKSFVASEEFSIFPGFVGSWVLKRALVYDEIGRIKY